METQLKLIPASEHPTALESQWLNAISPADFINNNKNFDVLMMKYRCAIREIQTKQTQSNLIYQIPCKKSCQHL